MMYVVEELRHLDEKPDDMDDWRIFQYDDETSPYYRNDTILAESDWDEPDNYIVCFTFDGGSAYMEDRLRQAFKPLFFTHCFCFGTILMTLVIAAFQRSSYIHNLPRMFTVPLYQASLFRAYYEVCRVEELATERRCTGISFAHRRAWLYIEISAFIINIA